MPDPAQDALNYFNQLLAGGAGASEPPRPAAPSGGTTTAPRPSGTTSTRSSAPFTYNKGPGQREARELEEQGFRQNPFNPSQYVNPQTWQVFEQRGAGGFYQQINTIPNYGTGATDRIAISNALRDSARAGVPPIGAPSGANRPPQNSVAQAATTLLSQRDLSNVLNREQVMYPNSRASRMVNTNEFPNLPQAAVNTEFGTQPFFTPGTVTTQNLPPIQLSGPQTANINMGGVGFGWNPSMILADNNRPASGNVAVDALASYLLAQSQGATPDWAAGAPAPNQSMEQGNGYAPGFARGGAVVTQRPAAIVDLQTRRPLAMVSEDGQPELNIMSPGRIDVVPMMAEGGSVDLAPTPFFTPAMLSAQANDLANSGARTVIPTSMGMLNNASFFPLLLWEQALRNYRNKQNAKRQGGGGGGFQSGGRQAVPARLPIQMADGGVIDLRKDTYPTITQPAPTPVTQPATQPTTTVYGTEPIAPISGSTTTPTATVTEPTKDSFGELPRTDPLKDPTAGGGGTTLPPTGTTPTAGPVMDPIEAALRARLRDNTNYRWDQAGLANPDFIVGSDPNMTMNIPGLYTLTPAEIAAEEANRIRTEMARLGSPPGNLAALQDELAMLQVALGGYGDLTGLPGGYAYEGGPFLGTPQQLETRIEDIKSMIEDARVLPRLQQRLTNLGY